MSDDQMCWIYWDSRSWFFEARENKPPTFSRCVRVSLSSHEFADYARVMAEFERWQERLEEMAVMLGMRSEMEIVVTEVGPARFAARLNGELLCTRARRCCQLLESCSGVV
jgi:hypothetical protein